MQYRHEVKHEISAFDRLILRQRLRTVLRPDAHAQDGKYEIRSLYFDTPDDRALREKWNGANIREKYRIRLYNRDTSVIHLERKYKCGGLGFKETACLTPDQARAIAEGDIRWMAREKNEVLLAFYARMCEEQLRAKVIVDYTREPFVFEAGNVRVTLDYNIRTGLSCIDFLNPDCVTLPVADAPCILEVKWDQFLPELIRDILQLGDRNASAYSKYAACRMFD